MDPKELQRLINGDPQQPQQPPQETSTVTDPQAPEPSGTPATLDQQAPAPADIVIPGEQAQGVWDVLSQGFNAGSQVNPEIINHDYTPAEASAMKDAAVASGMPAVTGGLKSVFETKDFLFGDTPPDQQSSFRQGIEAADASMKQEHPIVAGLASGILPPSIYCVTAQGERDADTAATTKSLTMSLPASSRSSAAAISTR